MKVLMVNGSPHANGCVFTGLSEISKVLNKSDIETEIIQVGHENIRGCIACNHCVEAGKCVFDDAVNATAPKFAECDGLIVGSPVYFASANGNVISFLDRLFYSAPIDKSMKVAAAIVSARRGGCSATFDELNKYFTVSGMPIVASQYWNAIHGTSAEEAKKDVEGLQTMRTLGRNMAFLLKSIELGKEQFGLPEKESDIFTNFIH